MPSPLGPKPPEAAQAVRGNQLLPVEQFFGRQPVTFAGFGETDKPVAHGDHDLSLTADYPALGVRWWEVLGGQWLTCGTGYTVWPT